jgi:hypothetical protein
MQKQEEFYIGYDAMPQLGKPILLNIYLYIKYTLGRVKTGYTPATRPPPLDFAGLHSDGEYTELRNMASSSEDGYSTTDRSNQISEDSFTSSDASFRHR